MSGAVVRQMQRGDARRVAKEVRRASRRAPGMAGKLIGTVMPTWLLARIYRWLQTSGRGEVWIAQASTAMAGVVALRRGSAFEAVDFFSTGEMLGFVLATELLERADREGIAVVLETGGRVRQEYFRRFGFEPAGGRRMLRRPRSRASQMISPDTG